MKLERILIGFLVLAVFGWAASSRPILAQAQQLYQPGSAGSDLSWPQCGQPLPSVGAFGIVGVTGGKSFEPNPCLDQQWQWAKRASGAPQALYMNANGAVPETDPAHLAGPLACAPGDEVCRAYDYGWHAADYAFGFASQHGATASVWWLDVETINSWLSDPALNAATLRAEIEYLRARGVTVGIYSTATMWNDVTGGIQDAGLPIWYAGIESTTCEAAPAFTGGRVWLVQSASGAANGDHAC